MSIVLSHEWLQMSEPLVSVMIVTYNQEPYISEAIESVLNQKVNFPIEIVIGEDASSDGTREIVRGYEKKYPNIIRVITSENNVGLIKNYYRTEKACRGKYIAWCEGDDFWHNQYKLQKQVDYMESHPECGLVHSDYSRYYVAEDRTINNFNHITNNKLHDNLDICSVLRGGKYLYILTCTVLARREILFKVIDSDPLVYRTSTFSVCDTVRWAEIAQQSKTHYIDESLSTYRIIRNSISKSSNPVKRLEFGKSINELFLYLVEKHNLPKSEYEYHLEKWCQIALQLAFERSDKSLAKEIRRNKVTWSIKEQILYYGTINNTFNKSVKVIRKTKRMISRSIRNEQWGIGSPIHIDK
jgi:glycosyltransferase involved in cell wall biosynthesis